jgi:hypothetical protein
MSLRLSSNVKSKLSINQQTTSAAAASNTYYVSSTGSDSNSGLSTGEAWQTIARANSVLLLPGTSVLFQCGQTYSGALAPSILGSNPAQPITFGSYGGGRATISSGTSNGFSSLNFGGIIVRDLIFTGSASTNYGIKFDNNLAGNIHLQNIQAVNCDVSGYGRNGIYVTGSNGSAGFDDVLIEGCTATGCCTIADGTNGVSGIYVFSPTGYGLAVHAPSFKNVRIVNCASNNNLGTADVSHWSGSAIVIAETRGGLIYNCTADSNGANAGVGNIGIWTFDSINIVIDGCKVSNQATAAGDGGGFDIDGGCTDCTIRNCYSRNNAGAGYLIFSYGDGLVTALNRPSIINCVSENDGGTSSTPAGILVAGGATTNVRVYGNTIKQGVGGGPNCIFIGDTPTGTVENNTCIISGAQKFVCTDDGINPSGVIFSANRYISAGACAIRWNSSNYTSIAAWNAGTGQEAIRTVN